MNSYSIQHIAEVTNGKILQSTGDGRIEHLIIDSRRVIFPSTSVFFALGSARRNGHQFIEELYHKGVRNFVVSKELDYSKFPQANIVLVSNCLQALQLVAAHHRNQYSIPVIGITGSNGKTIVKEWLNQLLQEDFNIVRSPRSFNSQIGVPLSVWQIGPQHELGIFEAGISLPGEMEKLESIIQPTIGIFTNIGEAHSEGFTNREQKISEKIKLFANTQAIIYCADEQQIDHAVQVEHRKLQAQEQKKIVIRSWGRGEKNFLRIQQLTKSGGFTSAVATVNGKSLSIEIPFTDEASIHNAITCWCTLLHLGIHNDVIQKRMGLLEHISMRLELKRGINHCTVINDSYSADLSSLNIALDLLSEQRQHQKHTVIISDFLQSGLDDEQLYSQIAGALLQHRVTRLIGLGEQITKHKSKFNNVPQQVFFHSTQEFISHFRQSDFNSEAILLKGARVFAFEEIDRLLTEKLHQTVLEIDLDALIRNLKEYQKLLRPSTKIMAMVKAFSYGSGSYEIASTLQFNKVDFLSVAYADEGVELRKAGITIPIMVMNADESSFPLLVDYVLQPVIYSPLLLEQLQQFLLKEGSRQLPVHLEINSGMNRLGFEPQQLDAVLQKMNLELFKVVSVFSHFAASEDPQHDAFSSSQFEIFVDACKKIQNALPYSFLKHMANTAAAERYPEWQLDMVRLGIGLYGIDTAATNALDLQQVSTLKSTIAQLRKVASGESVSYGRQGVVDRDSIIATVRIGYADGYPRSLSNGKGKMYIKGQLAPIIGTVCMDMTMIDVTDIAGVCEGDEVIIFGNELHVQHVAHWAGTIAYEILTGVSQRVKRVYYKE